MGVRDPRRPRGNPPPDPGPTHPGPAPTALGQLPPVQLREVKQKSTHVLFGLSNWWGIGGHGQPWRQACLANQIAGILPLPAEASCQLSVTP